MPNVTRILSAIEAGDPKAAAELLPLVYDELRKLAAVRPPRRTCRAPRSLPRGPPWLRGSPLAFDPQLLVLASVRSCVGVRADALPM